MNHSLVRKVNVVQLNAYFIPLVQGGTILLFFFLLLMLNIIDIIINAYFELSVLVITYFSK